MDVLDSLAFLTTLSLLEHVKSRKSKAVVVVGLHPPIGVTWLRYMAPDIYSELSNGESQHTGSYKSLACDIFALNLVILAVFAEMPRIGGFRLAMKTTMAIASGRVTSRPRKTKRQFSDQLWDLMEHCWTFYPKGRPLIEDVLALLTNRPGKSKQVDVNPSVAATRLGVEKLYKTTRAAIGYTLFGTQSFTSLRKLCRALGRYPRKCTINEGLNITNHTPIGAGTFGDVYRGRYDQHDVALKVIRVFRSSDRDDREVKGKRFSMEAMMWHFLQHENLVPFLGVSTTIPLFTNASEPPLCLVSEWMPHGTLCEYTVNHPSASGLKLLSEIADGLSYLHSYSLVHGDLKGANIFINKEHRACIADFGLTRFIYDQMLSENNELATAMEMSGSLRWMSRELLFPNDDSPRVPTLEGDMYAFGMVMWETFTGKIPYPDETDGGLMLRVYLDRRPERPPNSLGLGLTDEVWDLMVRCWHGEVHHRPTASSALQELQTALNCGYSTTRPAPSYGICPLDVLCSCAQSQVDLNGFDLNSPNPSCLYIPLWSSRGLTVSDGSSNLSSIEFPEGWKNLLLRYSTLSFRQMVPDVHSNVGSMDIIPPNCGVP
ncbi:hypothetical protein JAAARDRAFT_51705 [Jaapia argillacea MUCL 33604]|uniref:Protein kinase domain-containing protein n=1 Tax=Jaapia argillacea MUCL 33604 TaxID=933084 RepID=A0A067P6V2_9AGAM|nr:hypothetical protein JAAARDRAFT_51705 [Jaapia argillacea MUCL 33604]